MVTPVGGDNQPVLGETEKGAGVKSAANAELYAFYQSLIP
jgi:hypothetical protein